MAILGIYNTSYDQQFCIKLWLWIRGFHYHGLRPCGVCVQQEGALLCGGHRHVARGWTLGRYRYIQFSVEVTDTLLGDEHWVGIDTYSYKEYSTSCSAVIVAIPYILVTANLLHLLEMVYSWLYNTQSLNALILVFSTDLFLTIDWPNVVHTLWISYTAYTCNIVCFLYFSYSCTICFQHSIDIVHSNSRRPFVNSHLFIYIDGNLKLGSQLKFPNVSEVHTNTRKRHKMSVSLYL